MPKKQHQKAAEHHGKASKHHKEAVKHHESGDKKPRRIMRKSLMATLPKPRNMAKKPLKYAQMHDEENE